VETAFELRFTMTLTHDELASLAGTSRETATRLVNQFERDGIISRDSSIITILRSSDLERLAQ
jgi:CRP/FNR family transcriptional regulator